MSNTARKVRKRAGVKFSKSVRQERGHNQACGFYRGAVTTLEVTLEEQGTPRWSLPENTRNFLRSAAFVLSANIFSPDGPECLNGLRRPQDVREWLHSDGTEGVVTNGDLMELLDEVANNHHMWSIMGNIYSDVPTDSRGMWLRLTEIATDLMACLVSEGDYPAYEATRKQGRLLTFDNLEVRGNKHRVLLTFGDAANNFGAWGSEPPPPPATRKQTKNNNNSQERA